MVAFHYEWWTVKVKESIGTTTWELKAKNKENIIRQIKKEVERMNNSKIPCPKVIEVYWDTLQLDRVGYQRLS